jgi:hypothetical protein
VLGAAEPVRRSEADRRASVLAQQLAGFLMDEMKPGAGETDHGDIGLGSSSGEVAGSQGCTFVPSRGHWKGICRPVMRPE